MKVVLGFSIEVKRLRESSIADVLAKHGWAEAVPLTRRSGWRRFEGPRVYDFVEMVSSDLTAEKVDAAIVANTDALRDTVIDNPLRASA